MRPDGPTRARVLHMYIYHKKCHCKILIFIAVSHIRSLIQNFRKKAGANPEK